MLKTILYLHWKYILYAMLLRTILLLSFILLNLSVKAQFRITPQVGLIMSKVITSEEKGDLYSKQYNHYGLSLGINALKQITEKWKVTADFSYNEKGADVNGSFPGDTDLLEIRANYFETGISAEYNCFKNISIEVGPYYAHLLKLIAYRRTFGTPLPPNDETSQYNDEFGLSFGGIYEVYNFSLRLRYTFGILGYKSGLKNHSFVLAIGYVIKI